MPDPNPPPTPTKLKTFLRRLVSFVVLWTIVLTALFSSNRLMSDIVFLVIMVFLADGVSDRQVTSALRDAVCRYLGVGAQAPTLGHLNRLIHAYTSRSPWESVTRILKRQAASSDV